MMRLTFSAGGAIAWGALVAGVLDLSAVLGLWAVREVAPTAILQSIASSVLGAEAFEGGERAAALGLFLHFLVSFSFAAAYIIASARLTVLRARPLLFGPIYGAVAYVIMTFAVVPMSRAEFGGARPPPPVNLAASVFIHLCLFGLPIALAASRIAPRSLGSARVNEWRMANDRS